MKGLQGLEWSSMSKLQKSIYATDEENLYQDGHDWCEKSYTMIL